MLKLHEAQRSLRSQQFSPKRRCCHRPKGQKREPQRAVILHLTAMTPVLSELRDISPGFAWMIRVGAPIISDSLLPLTNPSSELNRQMRKKVERRLRVCRGYRSDRYKLSDTRIRRPWLRIGSKLQWQEKELRGGGFCVGFQMEGVNCCYLQYLLWPNHNNFFYEKIMLNPNLLYIYL